ncbi:MAG: ribbon-helix-helix domain-containing protein [Hyphomicrobiaceae bacterium]|nr:ribbon-helix-helix domain-containing protein [Hyphomicrobiaceae bacterium]
MEKRSVTIARHRTSIALEPEFWAELERLAAVGGQSLASLIADVDRDRGDRANLASALRVHVLARAVADRVMPAG